MIFDEDTGHPHAFFDTSNWGEDLDSVISDIYNKYKDFEFMADAVIPTVSALQELSDPDVDDTVS